MPSVATCLFAGRARRGSRVHFPKEERCAESPPTFICEKHRKNRRKDAIYELLSERLGSCIYARGRYEHPTRPSQGTTAFNRMCKHDSDFYVPFYVLISFIPFLYFFSFCGRQGCFPLLLRIPQL